MMEMNRCVLVEEKVRIAHDHSAVSRTLSRRLIRTGDKRQSKLKTHHHIEMICTGARYKDGSASAML